MYNPHSQVAFSLVSLVFSENLGDKVSWCQLNSVRWEHGTGLGQLCEASFPKS